MQNLTFDIGGHAYHALAEGDPASPLLLFLHGYPEYSGAWADMLPRFADRFYCVAPDQRGYGQSWRPEGVEHYATKHLVSDIGAMIDLFGQGRAAGLVGHDWGASVSYATAIRWPEKIAKLAIINGVHPAPFQAAMAAGGAQTEASQYITWLRREGAEDVLAKDDFAQMMALFSAKMDVSWLSGDKLAQYKAAWRDAAGLRAMINWYRASPLMVAEPGKSIPLADRPVWPVESLRIRMPHLLIWGMDDTALVPESRAGLEPYCDDLKLVEITGADHWVVHQKPDQVAAALAAFLEAP